MAALRQRQQAQGYDPKIIDEDAVQLPAPKKGNRSNGHGS
jgi:hypothetical protein